MRFVRRVRWLRVLLAGLVALVGLLSLRLWQWTVYAEGQAAGVERAEARVSVSEQEIDRLNRELRDARLLVHGKTDEIVQWEWTAVATLRPANERLEQILAQEYIPEELETLTTDDVGLLWRRLGEHRRGPR
jgi:hypothetical protein